MSESASRTLIIDSGNPTAEIYVLDGLGLTVTRAVEKLSANLPLGIYRIRYLAGTEVQEEFLELPPGDTPLQHSAPRVGPVVPRGNRPAAPPTSVQQQITGRAMIVPAEPLGTQAPNALGQLSIWVRFDSTSPPTMVGSLSVFTFDGQELGSISDSSLASGEGGVNLELPPGCYLLRHIREPVLEQCLYVAAGWRTEFIVPVNEDGIPEPEKAPAFMSKPEFGEPSEYDFGLAETARQTLGLPSNAAASVGEAAVRDSVKKMLEGKFGNPMLGIFGAHLLLGSGNPDRLLLTEVAHNLRALVGAHPDVLALFLYLGELPDGPIEFQRPPMLRSSWRLIVEHGSNARIPPHSYAARIGGKQWGWGAWLTWKQPNMTLRLDEGQSRPDFMRLAAAIGDRGTQRAPENMLPIEQVLYRYLAQAWVLANQTMGFAKSIGVDLDKQHMFSAVLPLVRRFIPSEVEKHTRSLIDQALDPQSIASALGIPISVLYDVGSSLAQKLELTTDVVQNTIAKARAFFK